MPKGKPAPVEGITKREGGPGLGDWRSQPRTASPRNKPLTIRFTEAEYERVKGEAAAQGLTVAEYCRRRVMG